MLKIIISVSLTFLAYLQAATPVEEYEDYVKRYNHGKEWNIGPQLQCTIAKQTLEKAKKQTKYKSAVAEWKETVSKICK